MKLQEAFMERNDIKKKIARLSSELQTVIITQEGDEMQFNPKSKLEEIELLQTKLMELNIKIDEANVKCTPILHEIRMTDALIAHYTTIRDVLLRWKKRQSLGYGETVIVMQKNFDFDTTSTKLESLELKRRELDRKIQKLNWEIEI